MLTTTNCLIERQRVVCICALTNHATQRSRMSLAGGITNSCTLTVHGGATGSAANRRS